MHLFLAWMSLCAFQHPAETFARLRAEARAQYAAGDTNAMIATTTRLHAQLPTHIPTLVNLALGHAAAGHPAESLAALQAVADLGLVVPLPGGAPFEAVRSQAGFAAYAARNAELAKPVGKPVKAFQLQERGFFPEGLAHDAKTGAWFVGSVHRRKIVRRAEDGTETVFVPEGRDGLLSVLGMTVDAARRRLWVCSSGMPQTRGITQDATDTSALYGFDADTGALITRAAVPGKGHALGDLTLNRAGDVFASDGAAGTVYRLAAGSDTPVAFVTSPWFKSPQGLCFSDDETLLYVADYTYGLMVVRMADREVTQLPTDVPYALTGIDGLTRHGNRLIALQNAYTPHRIVAFDLTDGGRRIRAVTVPAAAGTVWEEPTLGTVVDGAYYFVANSQWGKYDADNQPVKEGLQAPLIQRLPLTP